MTSRRSSLVVASLIVAVLAANVAGLSVIRAHRLDSEASRLRRDLADASAKVEALQVRPAIAVDKVSINGPWKFVNKTPTCEGWADNAAECSRLGQVNTLHDGTLTLSGEFGTVSLKHTSALEFSASTTEPAYAQCGTVETTGNLALTLKVTEIVSSDQGQIVARKVVGTYTVTTSGGDCTVTKDVRDFEGTLIES